LRCTQWSKNTFTRFFSDIEVITRITIHSIKYLANFLSNLYNTISAIVLDPEKNRVRVFLDHGVKGISKIFLFKNIQSFLMRTTQHTGCFFYLAGFVSK
jgi:hypothetical protein